MVLITSAVKKKKKKGYEVVIAIFISQLSQMLKHNSAINTFCWLVKV